MTFKLSLGAVTIHGDSPPGGIGFAVKRDGVTGLYGGVSFRRDTADRLSGHGMFAQRGWLAARVVTVRGYIFASSPDEAWEMGQVLSGLGGSGESLTFQVDDFLGVRTGEAFLASTPEVVADPRNSAWEFTVHVWMPDPLMYGATRETESAGDSVSHGNVASAVQQGNFSAVPTFTVTATTAMDSGYQIRGKGKTFEVPGPLNVGQVDVVDFGAGTVRRDGVIVRGVIPRTFEVGRDESVEWQLWPLSGAGSAVMHVPDTFA